jgi:hypothetical protein
MSCQLKESAQLGMVAVIAVAATECGDGVEQPHSRACGTARSHLPRDGH